MRKLRTTLNYCVCVQWVCLGLKMSHSHEVPNDAGAVTAGSDTLVVVTLDFDTSHGGLVLLHGLQQPVAPYMQLPRTHLRYSKLIHYTRYDTLIQILSRPSFDDLYCN